MKALLAEPVRAFWLGCGLAALGLVYWMINNGGDHLGLASFISRFVHIAAAMVWVGMIWFVNFIQIVAFREAGETEKGVLLARIVPRVTAALSIASHLVVASGGALLLTTGYLFDRWVFPSSVYIPAARSVTLWLGALAGIAMWALAHGVIRPGLAIVLDPGESPASVASARSRIQTAARVNLVLAIPVTYAMVAAAHLY